MRQDMSSGFIMDQTTITASKGHYFEDNTKIVTKSWFVRALSMFDLRGRYNIKIVVSDKPHVLSLLDTAFAKDLKFRGKIRHGSFIKLLSFRSEDDRDEFLRRVKMILRHVLKNRIRQEKVSAPFLIEI